MGSRLLATLTFLLCPTASASEQMCTDGVHGNGAFGNLGPYYTGGLACDIVVEFYAAILPSIGDICSMNLWELAQTNFDQLGWVLDVSAEVDACGDICTVGEVCQASCSYCSSDEGSGFDEGSDLSAGVPPQYPSIPVAAGVSVLDCLEGGVIQDPVSYLRPAVDGCIRWFQELCSQLSLQHAQLCYYHVPTWAGTLDPAVAAAGTVIPLWYHDVFPHLVLAAERLGVHSWIKQSYDLFVEGDICAYETWQEMAAWAYVWASYVTPAYPAAHLKFAEHFVNGVHHCKMTHVRPRPRAAATPSSIRSAATVCGLLSSSCSSGPQEDLISIGLPVGVAMQWRAGLSNYLYSDLELTIGAEFFQPQSGEVLSIYPHQPANVSITLVLENLFNVDEVTFTFNIGFLCQSGLIVSWEDDRISTVCEAVGADGAEPANDDLCAHYWQPQLEFSNVLQYEEGTFELVQDLGLFTEVGVESQRALNAVKNPYLQHSLGYTMRRYKGTFVTPMGFQYFPFDCQTLLVRIKARNDRADVYRFAPMSILSPNLRYFLEQNAASSTTTVSGWNVTGIFHREHLFHARGIFDELIAGDPTSPLYSAIRKVREQTFVVDQVVVEALGMSTSQELSVPYYDQVSEATFAIQVKRESHSFVYNFALLVALLIFIAFSSFMFADAEILGRVELTLTVFLGVIFFQIMVVEALPRSNGFTIMHRFMFVSAVFNGVIVVEHCIVFLLQWYVGQQAALIRRVRKLKKSQKALRAVIRLQRAYRNHRIHREGLRQTQGAVPPPGAAPPLRGAASVALATHLDVQVVSQRPSSAEVSVDAITVTPQRPSWSHRPVELTRGLSGTKLTQRLQARLDVIEKAGLAKQVPLRRLVRRRAYNIAVVALANVNWFFTVTTTVIYFIVVVGTDLLLQDGKDEKCSNPWVTTQHLIDAAAAA